MMCVRRPNLLMKKSAGKAENEGGGSSGSNEDHGSSSNLDSSPKKSLPYNGSLQEAIKQQDREAVKYLMSLRQQQQSNNTIYPSNNDENESKHDLPESTSLQNCLLSLGFSSIQLHEYFHCDDDENNYQDDEYQKIIQSEALKTIFDSEKHFPNPTNKKLSKVSSPSSQDLSWNDEQHHVNPQMLRGLDPESTWTLLQCCVNHPTISQIQIYEILTQLNSLSAICLINQTTCKWLHNVLIKGYIMEVKCILFNLYLLLQTDAYSSSPRTDQTCSDQLLMSYMCPITREILVEPVTLQCGHNFSRTALELSMSTGNRRCPICKATVSPSISDFAVNVVLRDTIERLYPHVLLRRAVDDIQAAQRSGIKELRSVIRWLHNFPQSPEVVHAVISAITFWVRDSPDCTENRIKIIRDGHVAILCRIFVIVDFNSTAFSDLLQALRLIASPYSYSEFASPSQKVTTSSVSSMLSADIHVELMRIVSHKTKLDTGKDCFELLLILFKGLEESEVCLRKFIANSTRPVETVSTALTTRTQIENHVSPLLQTPPRGRSDSFPSTPLLTPSRSEKKDKEDRLMLLIRLMRDHIFHEPFIVASLSVCISLLTLPSFTHEEQYHHASLLVANGIIEATNSCFLHYMTLSDSPSSQSALEKLVMLVAKLAFRVDKFVRDRLNQTSQQYCIQILKHWNQFRIGGAFQHCDVLFSTCEALCALIYGNSSGTTELDNPSTSWLSHFSPQTLQEIVKLLEYRSRLQTLSVASLFACPQLQYEPHPDLEIRNEAMFSLIYLASRSYRHKSPAIVQILPPIGSNCRGSDETESEIAHPLMIGCRNSGLPIGRLSTQFSLSLSLSSQDIYSQPVYLVITKSCDNERFQTWIKENPRGLMPHSPSRSHPLFPFVRVDLKSGTFLRMGVTPVETSASGHSYPKNWVVEECLPMSVVCSDKKSFKIDIAGNNVLFNINGLQTPTYSFPLGESNQVDLIERSEEEKLITEYDDDRHMIIPGSVLLAGSLDDCDSAERFLSSVIAAVAHERRMSLMTGRQSETIGRSHSVNNPSSQEQSSDENGISDELKLSAWLIQAPADCNEVEEDRQSRMIFVTSETETLHDDDFEMSASSAENSKFIHSPVIWERVDDRFLRTGVSKGRVLFSNTQTVGIESITEAHAISTPFSEGVHVYDFQIFNQSASCVLGISTGDGPFQTLNDLPLALFSFLYHSNGLIQLVVPSGSHPCVLMNEGNPKIEVDDSIVMIVSHEEEGSLRVFHNNHLIYRLENLHQYICIGTPLSAFVSLSKPGDEVVIDHYLPKFAITESNSIDWKWLKTCFSDLHIPATMQEIPSDLQNFSLTTYSHHSATNFHEYFSLLAQLNFTFSHHPCDIPGMIQIIEKMCLFLSEIGSYNLCPKFCSFQHKYTEISDPPIASAWIVECPIAYDLFLSLIRIFSAIPQLSRKGIAMELQSEAILLIVRTATILICKNQTFRPLDILNAGLVHYVADYLTKSPLDEIPLIQELFTFIQECLNAEVGSFFPASGVSYVLLSSGLILKLTQFTFKFLNKSGFESLVRRAVVVVTEVMSRLKDRDSARIENNCNPPPIGKSYLPSEIFHTECVERNFLRFMLSMVSSGQWHRILASYIQTMFAQASFPETYIHSLLDFGCVISESALTSVCFDHRTQSKAHIWLSRGSDRFTTAKGKGKNISQSDPYEIIPDINSSSGNASNLLLMGPEHYWTSGSECQLPHWIDIRVSKSADWSELQIQCPLNVLHHPNVIRILSGDSYESLTPFRVLNVVVSPHWQVVVNRKDIPTICDSNSDDLVIRLEIVNNISSGSISRIDGLRLVGFSSSSIEFPNQSLAPKNFARVKSYHAKDWVESLYFDLLEGNAEKVEAQLVSKDVMRQPIFTGYGPWMWGHPGNNGFIGLIIPCTISSAISQMLLFGFSSLETQEASLRASNRLPSSNLPNLDSLRIDENSSANNHQTSQETRSLPNIPYILLPTGAHHQSFSTAMATIEAIRSLVREEQIRIMQSSQRVSENSDLSATLTNPSLRHSTGTGSSKSGFATGSPMVPSGPSDFTYYKADGTTAIFDASYEACAPFGLLHSQTVKSHRFPEIGTGVVIGVFQNKLWIHLEKNIGASYRDDNWQFAELYTVASEGQALTSVVKSSQILSGRTIKISDRVRRGPNWQWYNQDVYAGNLGTVVENSENDLWVHVEWDGGDRNTYRWGAEGCYDLEIVDGSIEPKVDRKVQSLPSLDKNNKLNGMSINEALTTEERIRCTLWRSQVYPSVIVEIYRAAKSSKKQIIATRCCLVMMSIAEYSIDSARSLTLSPRDFSELMHAILVSDTKAQLLSAKFLSIICSSGLIYDLAMQPIGDLSFPITEILALLKLHGPCSQLLLHCLRFLRDISWLCLLSESQNTRKKQIFEYNPPIDHRKYHNFQSSEFILALKSSYQDPQFIENFIDLLIPMFHSQQSSSALIMTLDLFSYLINCPSCLNILLSRNIDLHLINFSKELLDLQISVSLKMIFHQLMSLMLEIESRVGASLPSLLSTILVFADIARDYHSILQTIQMHASDVMIVCRCVEILLGGRRRYRNKQIPSPNWRSKLKIGDLVDAKDKSQLWYEAIIKNINENKGEVFVHYIGWGTKYDEWIPIVSDRLQLLHSETGHWRDNLRLDDPVEILCIHNEGSEIKRRWFRGIVSRMNETCEKLLVEYDKRGSHEERWVSILYDEEICKVGTHVPSAIGSTTDILKSLRRKQLFECNTFGIIVELLQTQLHSIEITRAGLETLQYLLTPQDGQLGHQYHHIEPLLSQVGQLLCQCIEFYLKKSDQVVSYDGSQPTPSEDIIEIACDIIQTLSTLPTFDSTGVETSGNENQSQQFHHQFLLAYANATKFIDSIVASSGYHILLNLLITSGKVMDIQVLIPTLSIFCTMIQLNLSWSSQIISLIVESGGMEIVVNLAHMLTTTRSSARLVTSCLNLLQYIASSSLDYKISIYQMRLHETCIRCVSSFPNQPRVLAASLGLLAAIISKDGTYHYPQTLTSSGPFDFNEIKHSNRYLSYWKSSERLPSLDHPHWIEVPVPQGKDGWRELSILLMDYGISSPESLSIFYRYHSDKDFFEIKRYTALDRSGEWCPFLTWEEVKELYEQWQEDPQTLSGQGTIRIEIPRNHNNGVASYLGGLRVLYPRHELLVGHRIESEEQRKDAISAMDGISMIVECLLQSKSSDKELYQSGRLFLQSFASNEQRAQFVVDCGGGYIL